MKNRQLLSVKSTFQLLLNALMRTLRYCAILVALVSLGAIPATAQDNSFALKSSCGTEQGNYEFGVYARVYAPPIFHNANVIVANTQKTLNAKDVADEVIGILSGFVSLKGAIGTDDALELLSNSYPIVNDGLDVVGANPFGPVAQHITEYVTGAGASIATGGIRGGALFVAEESIYLVKDALALFSLWNLNKDLRTLNAVTSIAYPYFKSCRNYSYVASRFGYPDNYPKSEIAFFRWMLDRIDEGNQGSIDEEGALKLLIQLSNGVRQSATAIRNRLDSQSDPVITGVTPPVLIGSTDTQTITVRGVGFSPSVSLRFSDGTTTYDRDPVFVNATTLRYDINVGTEAAEWTVQVRDGSSSSNISAFEVQAATFEDKTPPGPPQDFNISPHSWTDENTFEVFWVNPSDPSGITKVWYKLGDAPAHPEDGTPLNVQRHNPFSVTITAPGETPVHVWLEDGAGNKSHYNHASAIIKRDITPPSVTIQEPIADWSRGDDPYPAVESTITLEGTMSNTQSEIVSVFWINSRGGHSFGDFSGSSWTLDDIPLHDGANAIGALVLDAAGNLGFDILGVTYDAPAENYTLNVSATNGTVEVDPNKHSFAPGTEVTLTAIPDNDYEFDEWDGDASGDENPLTLTLDSDKSVTAVFTSDGGGGGGDGPDLVIEDPDVDPSEVAVGEEIEVSYTIANRGNADVGDYADEDVDSWQVAYYLSRDDDVDEEDKRLGAGNFIGPDNDGILAPRRGPGWEDERDDDVEVPDIPAGEYYVLIVADADDEVSEADEDNNIGSIELTVTGGGNGKDGPDLVIDGENVEPSTMAVGEEVKLSFTIANRGNENVGDYVDEDVNSWKVVYYLSKDNAVSEDDERLGASNFIGPGSNILAPRRAPGWEEERDDDEEVPNVPPGEYYVLFVADAGEEVSESNEHNNVEAVEITITDGEGGEGPDLVIEDSNIDPPTVKAGGEIGLSYTVANRGTKDVGDYVDVDANSWEVAHYLSRDSALGEEDVRLGASNFVGPDSKILVPRRAPGWTEETETTETIPIDTQTGDYYVLIAADDEQEVRESAEGNNLEAVPITIEGRPASMDLSISQSFGDPEDQRSYRLVALPGNASVPVASTLEGEAGGRWRVFWDNGKKKNHLVEYDGSDRFDFAPGRGFWMITAAPWQAGGTVKTVTLREDGSYAIDLHAGWNIISNPFGVDLSWAAVQEANGGLTQMLREWNGDYKRAMIFASAKSGKAYYYMNARGLDKLILPYSSVSAGNAKTKSSARREESQSRPVLTLAAAAEGDTLFTDVRIGLIPEAETGFDAFDQYAPPGAFTPTRLYLKAGFEAESGHDQLAAEYRSAGQGQVFEVVLRAELGQQLELRAEGLDAFAGREVVLVEHGTLQRYDLHRKSIVRLQPEKEKTRFTLLIGSAAFVEQAAEDILPEKTQLLGSYPNPFTSQATIAYTVAEPSEVRLVVYDLLGRRVRVLVDEKQEPGRKEIAFDGRGLASGVYIYRLTAGDYIETGKLVLVR